MNTTTTPAITSGTANVCDAITATTCIGIPTATTTRVPSAAELKLKLALRVACYSHSYSMCQQLGIYPT